MTEVSTEAPSGDPIRRIPKLLLVLIVPVIALIAIGVTQVLAPDEKSSSPAATGGANAISIKNFTYVPPTLTAAPGAEIAVTNDDQTVHTVTANDKSFDTGDLDGGASGTITAPDEAGSYDYICDIHQYMQGTLKVQG
jgi:plastocyanin